MPNKSSRYAPIPTKDRDDSPTIHTHININQNIDHPPPSPLSLYPPSPHPNSFQSWSESLVSFGLQSLSKLTIYFSALSDSLPSRDKSINTHFRFRRLWFLYLFAFSTTAIILILLSIFHLNLTESFTNLFKRPTTRLLDAEDDFRWPKAGPRYFSRPSRPPPQQIPFLLNRFGYPDSPSHQSTNRSNTSIPYDHQLDLEPVPSILHVVPPGKNVFSYLQWLSITSAVTKISPSRTMAHMIIGTIPEPGTNFWWDEVIKLPGLEIHEVEDKTSIFGNPILDVSHKTDVIRLEMLKMYGGIYLDTDVLVLRSFEELMTGTEEVIMGVEKADGTLVHPTLINGLCNAVIIAKRNSKFLIEWYDRYRSFQGRPFRGGGIWNYHSVILPWAMAKDASEKQTPITVLDHQSFFMPLWDDPGLRMIHGTLNNSIKTSEDLESKQHDENLPTQAGFDLESTGQFAYHMWHHLLDERISIATDELLKSANDLSPEDTLERDSSFNLIARKYLSNQLLDRYQLYQQNHPKPAPDQT
ncbi:hypothetical protein CROQUDRAFT_655244 [Cronartium quercuum f. sp. fusiforme G11]|uniref:Glycosyltransferase family 32 protein n=1 Tax=Cronartium quercuum f. sp. fusiforme G11 TaxID=708437 RepID=A0A9P6TDW3_9BASI|nr:hypothetical protein CROQUDRAFT_655244 [Cronartium quercuum f. sp. fusiforme G11]